MSDDPIGRCFGGGGELYCQGSSGPGDRAGGVAFLTVSRLTPFGGAPAGYVRLERVSSFFLAGLFGLADPAGLGGSETCGLLRLCRGGWLYTAEPLCGDEYDRLRDLPLGLLARAAERLSLRSLSWCL